MARRTKEEAEQTRTAILDAAEDVFMESGVARSSLQQIAERAGVTRGAVYWHFEDKVALVHAMTERVMFPEEMLLDDLVAKDSNTPVDDLHKISVDFLERFMKDPRHRRVMTILTTRCEYIDDLSFINKRQVECMDRMLARFARLFEKANRLGLLAKVWTPQSAAYGLYCFFHGLVATDIEGGGAHARKNAVTCLHGFFHGLKATR